MLLLRRGASRLVVVAAWLQVLLLVALLVLEVVAKMLRGIAASKRMRRPSFASAASPWCSRDGVNATALEGNATPRLPCRKPENSSGAGERDVLWTNAGFSAGFWAVQVEWYGFSLKSAPRLGRSARARLRVATRLSSLAFCRPAFYRKAKAMLDCL